MRIVIADEPGASWSPTAGTSSYGTLITTALGKRRMTVVAVGTLAPAPLTGILLRGGRASCRLAAVMAGTSRCFKRTLRSWEDFQEVLRVNPVAWINPHLRRALEREHKVALASDRAARTFKQYRLNIPGDPIETQPLITTAEWARVCARSVPGIDEGAPIVGLDLGGTRSWSAASAIWPSGRIEAWALAPGVPTLSEQERSDHVHEGTYSELVRSGGLAVDAGRAVPGIKRLLSRIWGWEPTALICDNYRAPELYQAVGGRVRIRERARSGGEATSNIQSLRALLLDTEAGVSESSRALLGAAWAQTNLVVGPDGLARVTKLDERRSRDDAAAALLLAAGELARRPAPVKLRGAVISRQGKVTWL